MFTSDDPSKRGVRLNTSEGLWALHVSTPQFWAWRDWMHDCIGYKFKSHGDWLTVWDEWPPLTAARAASVAEIISKMRDDLKIGTPVPRRPAPWDGIKHPVPEEFRDKPVK